MGRRTPDNWVGIIVNEEEIDATHGIPVEIVSGDSASDPSPSTPNGFETEAILAAAIGLADIGGGIPAGSRLARFQVEGGYVRYMEQPDAVATGELTASVGLRHAPGDLLEIDEDSLTTIRFFRDSTASSTTAMVQYYK